MSAYDYHGMGVRAVPGEICGYCGERHGTIEQQRGNTPAQEPLRPDALKAEIRKLGSWTPEDWDAMRGGNTIAQVVNAVEDIIDRAALSGVPVERPETPKVCLRCGWVEHPESLTREDWDSFPDVPVEPPATPGLREALDAHDTDYDACFCMCGWEAPTASNDPGDAVRKVQWRDHREAAVRAALSGPPATEGEP